MSAMPSGLAVRIAAAQPSPRFQAAMGKTLAEYLAAADLLGRYHAAARTKVKTGKAMKISGALPMSPLLQGDLLMDEQAAGSSVMDFFNVPFDGAVDRLLNLTGMTKPAFLALARRYRQQAFTVAGLNDVALIENVKDALANVVADGGTLADFTKAVNQLTSDAGVEDLAAFQLSTVFQTNVQRAYANGHYAQMMDPDVVAALPYWKYMTAGDNRVRPNHAQLDGFVAQAKDTVWARIYPPNGFNCRCTVVPILKSEAPEDADVPGSQRAPSDVPDAGFAKEYVQ
jgi:SPP1 gp7 family putative phage head morphogenesis protein